MLPNTLRKGHDKRKMAQNLTHILKEEGECSGKMGEDLNGFIYNYNEAEDDYQLIVTRKLHYFHHVFDGDAKQYYRSTV